ncbi:unnamed protein product, partial [Vitis vinifera]
MVLVLVEIIGNPCQPEKCQTINFDCKLILDLRQCNLTLSRFSSIVGQTLNSILRGCIWCYIKG